MLIIAEIGTSHEGSEEKAKQLIDCAVNAGADAVKFQWVYADEILHPDTGFVKLPTGNIRLYDRFKQLECKPSFYKNMLNYAHSKGVKFICSPFGLKSLSELLEIKPDFVKIASPELNHFPMLEKLAEYRAMQKKNGEKQVPVIVSSGVSKLKDIEKALEILLGNANGVDFAKTFADTAMSGPNSANSNADFANSGVSLLHCITSYPAPESEYNLKLIKNLKNIFGVPAGVSDHSLDPILVPVLSVFCEGTIIEKHITLSKKTSGLDDPVALEGEQFALMVHAVHQAKAVLKRYGKQKGFEIAINQLKESYDEQKIFACLGNGVKRLAFAEEKNYGRTNRSLHFTKSLKRGEKVTKNDVAVLRTEKVLTPGIGPEFLNLVVGAILTRNVQNGSGVQFEDFISR